MEGGQGGGQEGQHSSGGVCDQGPSCRPVIWWDTGGASRRVERELNGYGDIQDLVFGAWGEASKGVHELVETMAECRVRSQAMSKGRLLGREDKSVVVGQIRRCLSVASVRANSRCLLDSLQQVGRGVREANGRREAGEWEEVSMRREREGQWLSRIGKNPLSRANFFLN